MKAYLVFVGETERYRGTLPDCTRYIKSEFLYSNVDEVRLLLMVPRDVENYTVIPEEHLKARMFGVLTYTERLQLNSDIERSLAHPEDLEEDTRPATPNLPSVVLPTNSL